MKKLFFASAFALFGAMNAQESGFEGKAFIMGQVGYNTSENKGTDVKTNEFAIVPVAGYFVAPTVAVGTGIGYTSTKTEAISNTNTVSQFVFQPLVRKYWGLGDKLYIFGQLSVPMAWGTTKSEVVTPLGTVSGKTNVSSYGVAIAPGLDYFLNNNWSVEASIGAFGFQSTKPKDGKATNDFNFGVNTQNLTLGVKYIF